MGILDGVEHTFSAVIGGVEHWAGDLGTLIDHAVSQLESFGIAAYGDIRLLVEYLIKLGEDPVSVLSRLGSHISSIGGDVVSTLEEIAHGVLTYGLIEFLKMKVEQALTPVKDLLEQNIIRGQMVADVHRTTLDTMQAKLTLLTSGSASSGMAWQGQSVEAMSASFADISTFINQLSDQIQHDGTQARLNQAFIQILEGIGIIAAGLAIIDIFLAIASAVVVVATAGVGALPVGAIDAGVLAAQLDFLLALVAADCLIWLIGTLAIYVAHHVIPHTTTTPITGPQGGTILQAHAGDLPLNPGTAVPGGRIYIPPKKGRGKPFSNPQGKGYVDDKGNIWEWAQDQHGGEHWDVQHPDGSHTNVAPNGKVIGKDNFPNNDSLVPEKQGGKNSGGKPGGKP